MSTTKYVAHFTGEARFGNKLRLCVHALGDDGRSDDDFVVSVSPNTGHLEAKFGLNRATAIALRDHLNAALAATVPEVCEVCNGIAVALDPNHNDLPIPCPECRTALHDDEYERREEMAR